MKTKMIKNAISMMLALLVFTTIGLTACSTNKQNKVIIWAWDAYANAAEKAVELYKGSVYRLYGKFQNGKKVV